MPAIVDSVGLRAVMAGALLALLGCGTSPIAGRCVADEECGAGKECVAGACVPLSPDAGCVSQGPEDCSNELDDDCNGLTDCADPACDNQPCGEEEDCGKEGLCHGGSCAQEPVAAGTVCRPVSGPCDLEEQCNGTDIACPTDLYVASGTACGTCGVCDELGGCNWVDDGTRCGTDLACFAGECEPCGKADQPCCENAACASGTVCDEGTCTPAPDAGARPDAGTRPDAGAKPDAGSRVDAGVKYTTVVMAGDIVQASRTSWARKTATLVKNHSPKPSHVMAIGDNARYAGPTKPGPSGSPIGSLLNYYKAYWAPATQGDWGQFDSTLFPVPGNHEYNEAKAQGYFDYFKTRFTAISGLASYHGFGGTVGKGYYSFDLNGWHFLGVDSDCVGGCGAGSAQEKWIKADLAAHTGMPLVAYWHHPRYYCTPANATGSNAGMQAIWADLYDAKADFVFNGHFHVYQRYKPLNKASPATVDNTRGLTEVIVGNTGVDSNAVCSPADSRVAKGAGGDANVGAFFFKIGSNGSYSFQYISVGGVVLDSGSGTSHHPL